MYHVQTFYQPLNYFCHVTEVFPPEEVEKILDLEDLTQFMEGQVGSGSGLSNTVKETRDCLVSFIQPSQHSEWLFSKFSQLVSQVNSDHFLEKIDMIETFQYTVYKENHLYSWHIDKMAFYRKKERKISATILLSDPSEYEGGEFQLIPQGDITKPITFKPNKGDVIFFASWMPHQVAPVTKGIRKSLVSWVLGDRDL